MDEFGQTPVLPAIVNLGSAADVPRTQKHLEIFELLLQRSVSSHVRNPFDVNAIKSLEINIEDNENRLINEIIFEELDPYGQMDSHTVDWDLKRKMQKLFTTRRPKNL